MGIVCKLPENPKDGPLYAIGIFSGSALIGALCTVFIKEELRRLKPKGGDSEPMIDTESSLANAF